MRKLRKCLKLTPAEHEVMKRLCQEKRLGRDRYAQYPGELLDLTNNFNGLTGRSDTTSEVLHYVRTKAKRGLLGTLGGAWRRMPLVPPELLSDSERSALLAIRRHLKVAEDNIAHDPKIAHEYAVRFAAATGRRLPSHTLATYLLQMRKDGLLEKLDQRHERQAKPFDDINDIGG